MPRPSPAFLLVGFLSFATVSAPAADLDEAMRAVETIRGLSFSGPVKSVTIDRSELPQRLRDQLTRTLPYSIAEWAEILEALLLVESGGGDTFDELISLYEEQVLAYYDPDTGTFYALRQQPEVLQQLPAGMAAEEGVVVHELMHALQDQHLAIGKRALELRRDTDASMAYHAVLEGEATLVMLAHLLEKSGADFDTLIREPMFDSLLGSGAAADLLFAGPAPRYFVESLKFPYLEGLRFVVHAYRRGGWAELDRVYANPPRSTREILHPDDYFARRFAPDAFEPTPAIPVQTLSVEHLGEFHWGFLAGIGNAVGWTGDRVTIAQNAVCDPTVLVETSWESEEAAQRFLHAYMDVLDRKGVGFLYSRDATNVKVAYGADRSLMERFIR